MVIDLLLGLAVWISAIAGGIVVWVQHGALLGVVTLVILLGAVGLAQHNLKPFTH